MINCSKLANIRFYLSHRDKSLFLTKGMFGSDIINIASQKYIRVLLG